MAIKYEDLWIRWRQAGDREARDRLIGAYLWLVRYVAGRLMVGLPPHYDQEDIEAHGCFGLIEAVEKYDPARGVRFETFAIPWIRGACIQGIRAMQWAPALRKRVRELEQAQLDLEARLGREPSLEELAQYMKLMPDELERRLAEVGTLSILSLEESLEDGEGEGIPLGERIADPNAPDPEEESYRAERRDRLAAAIDSLPEQERLVVSLFYYEGLMAREISELLGLSPARISQIHSRAILRLRGKLARFKGLMVS
jgi:RNA polymerase sigma factor for flagellar operon FliA